ncbi:MAG: chorismate mutase, partial [Clostridia bacterium]|nr:chorismate mutase [Clostridia bacterium]
MDKLLEARETIDRIDKEMAKLFTERMKAVSDVAAYKKEKGLCVLDSSREEEVIAKNTARIEDGALRSYYTLFLKNTMTLSKEYQHSLLEGECVAHPEEEQTMLADEKKHCGKSITVTLPHTHYDILVERGSLKHAAKYLNLQRRVLIVTDSGVPKEYAQTIASLSKEPIIVTVNEGEESKN